MRGEPFRIVIVGGSRSGKSTLAQQMYEDTGAPVFCGDPLSTVKEPNGWSTYLPEGLAMAGDTGAAAWIARNWFTMPAPWICEGWVMARALRRWLQMTDADASLPEHPCDLIIVFREQHQHAITKEGQRAQGKAVMTVWDEIAPAFEEITELR